MSSTFSSDVIREESIQQAKFFELDSGHERNDKFGDVINLANGQLEMDRTGLFQLVEINDICIKYCLEESIDGHNITAFWSIYKIRHRNEQRGYRYEWKITIRTLRSNRFEDKHGSYIRSFLIRDEDYPKYFDSRGKKKVARMEKRIFNTLYDKSEYPFQLDYGLHPSYAQTQFDRIEDSLNTGEYYAKGSTPVIKYQVRDGQTTHENANNVHHHYFLNQNEVPLLKTSHFEKVSTIPGQYNALTFPNGAVQPSQVSVPRMHNQLDSYGDVLPTTSHTPFHFPDEEKFQEAIRPTTYRGHYDDNRESILEGEIKGNSFNHYHDRKTLFSFPARHTNVVPISSITTTPSSYGINLSVSPASSSQSPYIKHYSNGLHSAITQNHPNHFYWQPQHLNNQHYNFAGSFPYHENTFSELDPIYHGPVALPTPSDVPPTDIPGLNDAIHNANFGFVSQLPLQNDNDDSTYDIPTEIHQTTSTNSDPSFTTPFHVVTTEKASLEVSNDQNLFPDSINAQLPPPDSGADIRVPYVEIDKSVSSTQANWKKNKKPKVIRENEDMSTEKQMLDKIVDKTTKKQSSNRYKSQKSSSSTERPSWAPKRPRLRVSDKYKTNSEFLKNSEKKMNFSNRRKITLRKTTTTKQPTTMTQEFSSENEAFTTTLSPQFDDEPRTSQSIRKSVSVHIAEKVTVMPKESTKTVHNTKHSEPKPQRRVAKIKKVEKKVEDSTENYLEQ